jgi:integrase
MMIWKKAATGVRYREHQNRRCSGRPDRYWVIYFRRDGRYIQEGLGWSSEGWNLAQAQAKLAEFKTNARTGAGPISSKEKRAIRDEHKEAQLAQQEEEKLRLEQEKLENKSFGDLIDSYIEWAEKNKASYRMDESRCRFHLKPTLGNMKAKDIDIAALAGFKEDLSDKALSPATIKHCMVLIRQIFNHNLAMGAFIGKNPISKGNIPKSLKDKLIPNKLDNQRLRFLSSPEATALLLELEKRSRQTHDIALISLRTGARFDEIASLEWQHVDLFNNLIQLKGKNGQTRCAFMTPDVKDALLEREQSRPDELVFKSTKNRKIGQISWAFWRTVKQLKLNEGITDPKQKIVFHSLRHTFASWLAQQGTSLFVIKELMGHEKIEMTMRYAHLLPDTKRDAVMQMFNVAASDNVLRLADHK